MGTWLIFAGFLFLINPDFYTLDIFPDLIGYFLISQGLKRLSFLEDRLESAVRYTNYLVLTAVLKLASNLLVFSTSLESDRLLIMFGFFVAELWLGLLVVSNLLGGIQYLAVRHSEGLSLKGFDVVKVFATAFFIVKPTVTFLPCSLVIFYPEVDSDPNQLQGVSTNLQFYHTFRNILFVVGAIVLLFLGIHTARVIAAYIRRCRSDLGFTETLKRLYQEKVTENESMRTRLSIRSGFRMFFLAVFFVADVYLDDIAFLPTPLVFLFVYLGMRKLRRAVSFPRWTMFVLLGASVLSTVSYFFRLYYWYCYRLDRANFPVSFARDIKGSILGSLDFLAVMFAVVTMLLFIKACAKKFTKYRYTPYFVALLVMFSLVAAASVPLYIYPSTFEILPMTQIAVALVGLYYQKKTLDDIQEEAEFNLM
jgi:hypothetical protein